MNIRYEAQVTSIAGAEGRVSDRDRRRRGYHAEHVVLCIGLQGNLRTLGVPGEDLPMVQYQLDDPDEYSGETIVVVGAGDAAIENALALAESNRVILINRADEFARAKQGNLDLVLVGDPRRQDRVPLRHERDQASTAVETDGKPAVLRRANARRASRTSRATA